MKKMEIMLIVLFSYFIGLTGSIKFILIPNTIKCLREQINKDVLLIGEFNVSQVPGQQVDYVVTDSKQEILARNDNVKNGRFSVVTEREEMYEICFRCRATSQLFGKSHQISLLTMRGVEMNKVLEEEHDGLMTVENNLKRLENLANYTLDLFKILTENKYKMMNTNESTHFRVVCLGIFSVCWVVAMAALQLFHFRNYFRARKIIE